MTPPAPRVLLLATDFPPARGGIQQLLANVAEGLSITHDLLVVAPEPPDAGSTFQPQYPVWRAPRFGVRAASVAALWLFALVAAVRFRPALILCGHTMMGPPCVIVRWLLRVPFVVMTYGSEVRSARVLPILRSTMAGAAKVVTISRFTADVLQNLGVAADRICIIAPGAGIVTRDRAPDAVPGAGGPVILTVARLADRYKGHDMVLRALPMVRSRIPSVQYVVIGDGPQRRFLEHTAQALGVAQHVRFIGEQPDEAVDAWYHRCDVFVMCSRDEPATGGAEGFGLVFIEAALRGKPVVAGRSGGAMDAVIHGETGLVIDPTDPVAIADAITTVLTDRDYGARLGERGRRRAERELSWDAYLAQLRVVLASASQTC